MNPIAVSVIVSILLSFTARRVYEHTPRMNRWWISFVAAALAASTTFLIALASYTTLTAFLLTVSAVGSGVYLREILNGLGRWLANPMRIIQLVAVIIIGYIALLAVVDPQIRASLFSLAWLLFILRFMFKGFSPIKVKKKS